jgi:predicted RND superfamily exporter protein
VRFLTRVILRNSLALIVVATLITVPCLYWTKQLYGNLRPDVEELLPRQSRSIQDLTEIRRRLQSIDNLAVLIFNDDPEAAKRFSVDLAKKLEKLSPNIAAGVEYRIDKELSFFDQRKALFLDVPDLMKIRGFIHDRIEYEKQLYNPVNIFSGINIPEPSLDFPALLNKYGAKSASFSHFPDGFYATPDGTKRAILIYLPANNSGIAGVYRLKAAVVDTIASLNPASYSPTIKIEYTGGVQNTIEEYSALMQDIERSAEIVFFLVTVFLWFYFRSWLAVASLFFSLFMARFWTFGLSWFLVGYLNANSAFMGSLLLGSGITFGVMLLSRYLEERRNGRSPTRAAYVAMNRTARATWTAALAAGMAYGSLFLTRFEGFRQYGIIGLIGMILCWISSIAVFPAVLLQVERIRPFVKKGRPRNPWIFGPLSRFIGRFPGFIVACFLGLSILSVMSFARFDKDHIIETNLANLRNKESMTQGSGYFSKFQDEIFQRFLTPVALLSHSEKEAEAIATSLKEQRKDPDVAKLIFSVNTIHEFVPDDQKKKIEVLKEIQNILPVRLLHRLPLAEQKRVHTFLRPEAMRGFTQENLPKLILDKFTEKDGSIGKLVLVEPPLESTNWSGQELNDFVRVLRTTGDQVAGGKNVPVAGGMPVVSDMIEAITQDGPKATLFAFLSVVLLILILFRKPRIVALTLFALVLGNLWLFGFILGTGFKINFLNFIALPITFRIGIDYGVNVFHRYLHEPKSDILKVIRETGGAVALCSLTTMTGYSSLIIARNQAFVSFGILAVIGEITSLFAAVIALPAFILVLRRRKQRDPVLVPSQDGV